MGSSRQNAPTASKIRPAVVQRRGSRVAASYRNARSSSYITSNVWKTTRRPSSHVKGSRSRCAPCSCRWCRSRTVPEYVSRERAGTAIFRDDGEGREIFTPRWCHAYREARKAEPRAVNSGAWRTEPKQRLLHAEHRAAPEDDGYCDATGSTASKVASNGRRKRARSCRGPRSTSMIGGRYPSASALLSGAVDSVALVT